MWVRTLEMAGAALLLVGCVQVVEPAPATCVDCHGSGSSPAPPAALGGITDPSYPGVGAHTAHLEPANALPVPCGECHGVPASVDAEGHIDTPWPAEVGWGPLSGVGASPFEHATLTCTVYCHGATLPGGANTTPSWTGGPGEVGCTTCHGNPPPPPHPVVTSCGGCHDRPAATQHIDGVLQLTLGGTPTGDTGAPGCAGCHGTGEDDLAPPPDTQGNVATTVTSVGAHQAHVTGGDFSAPVSCDTCHVVPASVNAPGHIDAAPAEVLPGVGWDGATCTNSCHSGPGAALPNPSWTTVDGSQDACGACHGLGPPSPHPGGILCEVCHPTVAGPGQTIAFPENHVNGVIESN